MDEIVRQFLDWDAIRPYLPSLGRGFLTTLELAFIAEAIALGLGLVLVVMRRFRAPRKPGPIRAVARVIRGISIAYINVMRGLPAIVVIYILWASFPNFALLDKLSEFQIGFLALGLVYAAYLAEVYRAGIESVDRGQVEAARSLGMSASRTMQLVVLPQAVRRMLPPFMNDFIALSKDTALVTIISVADVFTRARDAQSDESNASPLIAAAVFYLAFTLPLIWVVDRIYERQQRRSGRGEAYIP